MLKRDYHKLLGYKLIPDVLKTFPWIVILNCALFLAMKLCWRNIKPSVLQQWECTEASKKFQFKQISDVS